MPDKPRSRGRAGHRWRKAREWVARNHDVCHLCGQPIDHTIPWRDPTTGQVNPQAFTVDHLEPLSLNEDRALDKTNLKAAHFRCNAQRGNRQPTTPPPTSQAW